MGDDGKRDDENIFDMIFCCETLLLDNTLAPLNSFELFELFIILSEYGVEVVTIGGDDEPNFSHRLRFCPCSIGSKSKERFNETTANIT